MKKRLLSLLVAISMVLTFLPVSALTAAAAEDSNNGELKIGSHLQRFGLTFAPWF